MAKQKIQPVRGTHDLIGDDMALFTHIVTTARQVAQTYHFREMQTPLFEFSEVFHRSLGDTSDVVSKETYTFEDRGGDSITLRPEFTASIVRALISNGLTQQLPFKAFYAGAAFRYERPQKGRLRQFHQVGVECLGATEPWHDAEVIACAYGILSALFSSSPAPFTLEINTLGDDESRAAYRDALIAYFSQHADTLSDESRVRLAKNPLRILDSKQPEDRALVADAPEFGDYFSEASTRWFDDVRRYLDRLDIPYSISPRLVRGLDYYTHTVFEFTTDQLGSQATILAGGRYNGLVEKLGGTDIPGMGWAAGVERLMLLMRDVGSDTALEQPSLYAVIAQPDCEEVALTLAGKLRRNGQPVEMIAHKHIGKAIKKAETMGASHVIVVGETEKVSGEYRLKCLADGAETPLEA